MQGEGIRWTLLLVPLVVRREVQSATYSRLVYSVTH